MDYLQSILDMCVTFIWGNFPSPSLEDLSKAEEMTNSNLYVWKPVNKIKQRTNVCLRTNRKETNQGMYM